MTWRSMCFHIMMPLIYVRLIDSNHILKWISSVCLKLELIVNIPYKLTTWNHWTLYLKWSQMNLQGQWDMIGEMLQILNVCWCMIGLFLMVLEYMTFFFGFFILFYFSCLLSTCTTHLFLGSNEKYIICFLGYIS